jgi:6-phosphogluconolactonase (cycloisomerase 2 family)
MNRVLIGISEVGLALAILILTACGGGGGSPAPVTVGGTVSGLDGSGLVLEDNGSTHLTVSRNGSFTFATTIPAGRAYSVSVLTQPTNPSQTCVATNGSGHAGSSDVTNISVTCTTNRYTVSGTVFGLAGSAIQLSDNGIDTLPVNNDGIFIFPSPVLSGSAYAVSITAQPSDPTLHCAVTGGIGTVVAAPVSNVSITCKNVSRFAYVLTNPGSGSPDPGGGPFGLSVYAIDPTTGSFNAFAANPVPVGQYPELVAGTPNGRFVYVANNAPALYGFAVDAATGAITGVPGSPYVVQSAPNGMAIDPSSKFLYLANGGYNGIAAYAIDPSTGALTAVAGSPFPAGLDATSLVVEPSGKYLYAINQQSNNVSGYTIAPQTGALTSVLGSPFQAGTAPISIAADSSGKYIYAFSQRAGAVSGYAINAANGALIPVPGSPFRASTNGPGTFAIDPNSNFAYVVYPPGDYVLLIPINTATGVLGAGVGQRPINTDVCQGYALAVDRSGKFAYLLETQYCSAIQYSSSITPYSIDATTGAWTTLFGVSTAGTGGSDGFVIASFALSN